MTDQTDPLRIPLAHSVRYAVRGLPEVPNQYGPGALVPCEITLTYRATSDSQLGRVHAYVAGRIWADGKELPLLPGGLYGQHYFDGLDGWPEWLAEEARLHDPAAASAGQAPAAAQGTCPCGRIPDPGICPTTHEGRRGGGHCSCVHESTDQPATDRTAPATGREALRNRIRRVPCERDGQAALWGTDMLEPDEYGEFADAVLAVLPETTDRAAVLREAAVFVEAMNEGCGGRKPCASCDAREDAAGELSRLAAAPAAAVSGRADDETRAVCEGFRWIGQSFATCDRCGQPAWEHEGEDVPVEGAGPFDTRRTVRPWKPGEADAIRAKWGTPTADAPAVGGPQQPKEAGA